MGYAAANFGLPSGANVTTQVHTEYGVRVTGGNVGPLLVDGIDNEWVLEITGQNFVDIGEQLSLAATFIPIGSVLRRATAAVITAFTMTGTTPSVKIGTFSSEATNGVSLTQAQVQAVGFYDITATQAGTWAAATPLAARTQVGMALAGTTPTLSTTGEMRVTLTFAGIGLKNV